MSDFRLFCIAFVVCRILDTVSAWVMNEPTPYDLPGLIGALTVSTLVVMWFGKRPDKTPKPPAQE